MSRQPEARHLHVLLLGRRPRGRRHEGDADRQVAAAPDAVRRRPRTRTRAPTARRPGPPRPRAPRGARRARRRARRRSPAAPGAPRSRAPPSRTASRTGRSSACSPRPSSRPAALIWSAIGADVPVGVAGAVDRVHRPCPRRSSRWPAPSRSAARRRCSTSRAPLVNQAGLGSGPSSAIHIAIPKARKRGVLERVQRVVAERRLVQDREVPDVEVDRPHDERDDGMGEHAQAPEISGCAGAAPAAGPVKPSTSSSAAMSPISRCSAMCATSSWSASVSDGRAERDRQHDQARWRSTPGASPGPRRRSLGERPHAERGRDPAQQHEDRQERRRPRGRRRRAWSD